MYSVFEMLVPGLVQVSHVACSQCGLSSHVKEFTGQGPAAAAVLQQFPAGDVCPCSGASCAPLPDVLVLGSLCTSRSGHNVLLLGCIQPA